MEFLGVILDSLLIVLVIIAIILALKMFDTLTRIDKVLENAEKKLESLDNVFSLVDIASDKLMIVTDTFVSSIIGFIKGIFEKKGKDKDE